MSHAPHAGSDQVATAATDGVAVVPEVAPGGDSALDTPKRATGFAALRHRGFAGYLGASELWMAGEYVEHTITYWIIFQVFHSPVLGGYAVISHWVPYLLLSVYFGALADRIDCRKIIFTAQLAYMAVSLSWALLTLTGTLQVWHVIVLLAAHGLAGAYMTPATQLVLHDMVGRSQLQSAVRLVATGRQLATLLGPAIGGGFMLAFGPQVGLMCNVLLFTPLAIWGLVAPYSGHRERSEATAANKRASTSPFEALRIWRRVSGLPVITSMMALAGVSAFMVGNAFQPQLPEFAIDLTGAGNTAAEGLAYSALLAASAGGAILAGLLLESTGILPVRPRTAAFSVTLWCLAIAGFAFTKHYVVALALLFVAGALQLTFSSIAQTLVQLAAPPALRGRVIGLFSMSQQGLRLGSGVTVGVLGGFIGVHWSLGLSAGILFFMTLTLIPMLIRADHAWKG